VRRIDPTVGPRAGLYAHFRGFASPLFTICSPVAVNTARLKAEGGLFPGLLHAMMEAANAVPELRRRIRVEDGRDVIVEHPHVDCTCTAAREDGSFTFCRFVRDPDRARFVDGVRGSIDAAVSVDGLDLSQQHRDDLLYLSCLPWIEVTGTTHADSGDPLDCVPRILWGRVVRDRLSVCLTAHHALCDGVHVARFFAELERRTG
jgi:chloramphenicol O-acetyltransferase type A